MLKKKLGTLSETVKGVSGLKQNENVKKIVNRVFFVNGLVVFSIFRMVHAAYI